MQTPSIGAKGQCRALQDKEDVLSSYAKVANTRLYGNQYIKYTLNK